VTWVSVEQHLWSRGLLDLISDASQTSGGESELPSLSGEMSYENHTALSLTIQHIKIVKEAEKQKKVSHFTHSKDEPWL
jgi:hypothetical protein